MRELISTMHVTTSDCKKTLVFTNLQIRVGKTFIGLKPGLVSFSQWSAFLWHYFFPQSVRIKLDSPEAARRIFWKINGVTPP